MSKEHVPFQECSSAYGRCRPAGDRVLQAKKMAATGSCWRSRRGRAAHTGRRVPAEATRTAVARGRPPARQAPDGPSLAPRRQPRRRHGTQLTLGPRDAPRAPPRAPSPHDAHRRVPPSPGLAPGSAPNTCREHVASRHAEPSRCPASGRRASGRTCSPASIPGRPASAIAGGAATPRQSRRTPRRPARRPPATTDKPSRVFLLAAAGRGNRTGEAPPSLAGLPAEKSAEAASIGRFSESDRFRFLDFQAPRLRIK